MMTKSNPPRFLSPALVAALLLTAGAVWAQPGGGGRSDHPGPGGGLLYGPMADRLELSDDQRDAIRGIFAAQREVTRPWHEDLQSLGAELERAIEAGPFDEESVRALARQVADARVELAVSRARTAEEIRAVLTPDQRETLGKMRARRHELRGELGGRGGRGFHRRGPGR